MTARLVLQLNAAVGIASSVLAGATMWLVLTRPAEVAFAVANHEYGAMALAIGQQLGSWLQRCSGSCEQGARHGREHRKSSPSQPVPATQDRVAAGAIIMTMGLVMLLDRTRVARRQPLARVSRLRPDRVGSGEPGQHQLRLQGTPQSPLNGVWLIFIGSWLIVNSPAPVRIQLGQLVAARDRRGRH